MKNSQRNGFDPKKSQNTCLELSLCGNVPDEYTHIHIYIYEYVYVIYIFIYYETINLDKESLSVVSVQQAQEYDQDV